jgi:hypothetical protein
VELFDRDQRGRGRDVLLVGIRERGRENTIPRSEDRDGHRIFGRDRNGRSVVGLLRVSIGEGGRGDVGITRTGWGYPISTVAKTIRHAIDPRQDLDPILLQASHLLFQKADVASLTVQVLSMAFQASLIEKHIRRRDIQDNWRISYLVKVQFLLDIGVSTLEATHHLLQRIPYRGELGGPLVNQVGIPISGCFHPIPLSIQ